ESTQFYLGLFVPEFHFNYYISGEEEQETLLVANHCSSNMCYFIYSHRLPDKSRQKWSEECETHQWRLKSYLSAWVAVQNVGELARIGLILAIVSLTEAIAVGRSVASIKGYHLGGNKEMVAMGFMNIVGSFTSCYVATGSFSRSAVNFRSGCESTVSNIVMAITVVISLELFTMLLYYTPIAILASIILSTLPGLMDLHEVQNIWKIDKLDFLACIGAFFEVVFASVKIGLLAAVTISFAKIIILLIRLGVESLGILPGTDLFCHVNQYPVAVKTPGILIFRVKSALLCFANANFYNSHILHFYRIMRWVVEENNHEESEEKAQRTTRVVVLDMSSLMNIDTSGIASLEELNKILDSHRMQKVFDEIPNLIVVSWTSLIVVYVTNDCVGDAIRVFKDKDMEKLYLEPNEITLVHVLVIYTRSKDLDTMKLVHSCVSQLG
ncbi:hypothetical protein Ddye_008911, partial [Dipteronia dyeriana]